MSSSLLGAITISEKKSGGQMNRRRGILAQLPEYGGPEKIFEQDGKFLRRKRNTWQGALIVVVMDSQQNNFEA